MSREQKEYLRSLRVKKISILVIQILLVIQFFIVWEILANNNVINSFVFSKPSKIFNTIINYDIDFNNICLSCLDVIFKDKEYKTFKEEDVFLDIAAYV